MATFARKIRHALWKLNGYAGNRWSLKTPQKATVLITYYNPARMRDIETQIRNLLKCTFVETIIISNHNPEIRIEDQVKLRDPRLIFLNQTVKRGCGYRWLVANTLNAEYLIVIDDDLLLFPWQVTKLFGRLVEEPTIPHGLTGMVQLPNGGFEYHAQEERTVDYLCEIYAVTRSHLKRYQEIEQILNHNETVAHMIASSADFMVISQTGSHKPKIHNAGRLFRAPSFNQPGVAVHKETDFADSMAGVSRALKNVVAAG